MIESKRGSATYQVTAASCAKVSSGGKSSPLAALYHKIYNNARGGFMREIKAKLHALIDKMDGYQAELVLSFIKTLFGV